MTTQQSKSTTAIRIQTMFAILFAAAAGYVLKFHYHGPLGDFVRNWATSLAYEMFWIFAAFFVFPRRSAITRIAITVCIATIAIEFLQLWKPPWLQEIRRTFFGALVLGTSFVWTDLLAYPVGSAMGWFAARRIAGRA